MTAGRFSRLAAAALVLCLILCSLPAAAAGGERRTVRVALTDTDPDPDGSENRTGTFIRDYMYAVAEYADWNCDFVTVAWADALEMMKDGRLDVMLDVTRTAEREKWLNFSSESMGTEMCYLFGRAGTALQYEDFASFEGMTVGYEDGSLMIEELRAYSETAGFTYRARPFKSAGAAFAALDAGEIDAVVQTNFYDTPAGHVVLAKISPTPVYIATSKRTPALKTELDSAMAQLFSYNASFNADLFSYHFAGSASQATGYTQAEKDYLAKKPVVRVYYEDNWAPFEYDEDGAAKGITPEILRLIGAETGIRFEFMLFPSTEEVYTGLAGSAADTIMAVSYDYGWADEHDLLVTQPYLAGSVMRVVRPDAGAGETAAVVTGTYLENEVRLKYPALRTAGYATYTDCMDALARGKADCTFLNYYQASYFRSMGKYAELSYQPDENLVQSISLGVTRTSDPALFSLLSKALKSISYSHVQSILSESFTQTEPFTVGMLLRRYPLPAAAAIGVLGILIGLLAVLLVTSRNRRRQNLQLAAAKSAADHANTAKSEFLSRMSHDMRTPLNGIIGMTYLTGKMDLPPAAQENLDKISVSSHFLLSLINDLLDMTKAESGRIELHPEPYPSAELGQYIDAVIRPLCAGKNQTVALELSGLPGCVPMLDKLRVNQVLFNLLSNAVKYTPEGGHVCCEVRAAPAGPGRLALRMTVSDNGIGMSEAFQKVLFTPFTQEGRDDNSEQRGSGLGLAITKRLVERMGGEIAVESKIGHGSVFTVTMEADCIPAQAAAPAAGQTAEDGGRSLLAGRHALLCEDHPLNQEIARALLTELGLTVEVAEDGQRGLSAFSRAPVGYFDVILMDIRMPVMDGYQAARAIRALKRPDARTVPILAMSADVLTDDVQKCREAGMNGHIAKPIDPQALARELAAAVAARRSPEAF